MKICASVTSLDTQGLFSRLQQAEMAEFRLDLIQAEPRDFKVLWGLDIPIIATFRKGRYSEETRRRWLIDALSMGAAYVDIDMLNNRDFRTELTIAAHAEGKKVILSWHDFTQTPDSYRLHELIAHGFDEGADIVKIAALVQEAKDNARLLGLNAYYSNLVTIGMGEKGRITRLAALHCGAPFSYAALSDEDAAAPGQICFEKLAAMRNEWL